MIARPKTRRREHCPAKEPSISRYAITMKMRLEKLERKICNKEERRTRVNVHFIRRFILAW